jgi:hypothetical protein
MYRSAIGKGATFVGDGAPGTGGQDLSSASRTFGTGSDRTAATSRSILSPWQARSPTLWPMRPALTRSWLRLLDADPPLWEALLPGAGRARRFVTRTTRERWVLACRQVGAWRRHLVEQSPLYGNNRRFESCRGHELVAWSGHIFGAFSGGPHPPCIPSFRVRWSASLTQSCEFWFAPRVTRWHPLVQTYQPEPDIGLFSPTMGTDDSTGHSRHGLLVAGGVTAVIVLIGASALVWHLWQRRLPAVLEPLSRTPVIPVASPDPALSNNPVVTDTAPSVVKVRSLAPSCQKVFEGSGFVISPDRVMTNAHVVAGSVSVQVYASGYPLDATVVSYDPSVDIAILAVPNLPPQPLAFAQAEAKTGASVVVLGYPGGGNFTATPARIREAIKLSGPDIYRDPTPVTRDVYTIRANVEQGNTGGPLIDLNGHVLGVVFGAAVDNPDTGFVLTASEVASQLSNVGNTQPVATGACVS